MVYFPQTGWESKPQRSWVTLAQFSYAPNESSEGWVLNSGPQMDSQHGNPSVSEFDHNQKEVVGKARVGSGGDSPESVDLIPHRLKADGQH